MAYRKISVNDQEYEYVVGWNVVKVKGLGTFDKESVGEKIHHWDDDGFSLAVHPSHIRAIILNPENFKKMF